MHFLQKIPTLLYHEWNNSLSRITYDVVIYITHLFTRLQVTRKVTASESRFDSSIFQGNWVLERSFYWKKTSCKLEYSYLWFYRFDSPTNSSISDTMPLTNIPIVVQKVGLTTRCSWPLHQVLQGVRLMIHCSELLYRQP